MLTVDMFAWLEGIVCRLWVAISQTKKLEALKENRCKAVSPMFVKLQFFPPNNSHNGFGSQAPTIARKWYIMHASVKLVGQ